MHPKEFQKTKNTTGMFTHRNLKNSYIFKGIDFTNHSKINEIINNPNNECYILYPDTNAINISSTKLENNKKQKVLFLIDSTWPCSRTILGKSKNLQNLPKISFDSTKTSKYKFKTQPNSYCLSTIETTQTILELLNNQGIENLSRNELAFFTKPFEKMVEYQMKMATDEHNIRYKPPYKKL
jgi:DTW domain-containing protein YfiP